jgi:MoaA/NifB/PqqE/SkfB family radical SAM enzyme
MEDNNNQYRETFNTTIGETLSQAIWIISSDPALVIPGSVILHHQRKAAAVRKQHEQEGLLVPPVMITSITSRCNLACAGCYMHGRGEKPSVEMSPDILGSVVAQAADLGVSIIVIAGGEPLVRQEEIFTLAKIHPRILFPVFSNGLLIDDAMAATIAGCRNIVPVISFEGFRHDTDTRRGSGVYDRLLETCARLKRRNIFFGCSVTTTRKNFEQKKTLQAVLSDYNRKFPALFIGFPGDEDTYGGCLAAGRGFVHVSPSGDLEPCPAVPFSDTNLAAMPLKDALRSRLLGWIREKPEVLTESAGGCALRANRAIMQKIMGRE